MARIHPTAIVDASAQLGDDVEIGPYCIVEDDVRLGAGTVLRQHAIIRQHTYMGSGNLVDSFSVLGGLPQDLKFNPKTVTYLHIGDRNIFREGVAISRATNAGTATKVGNSTYWMLGAHAGHDSVIGDECILVNGSALAGHVNIGRRTIFSAHAGVHQFCWVGEMCIAQGGAIATQHIPPYCMWTGVSQIVGLNSVGLRRAADISDEDRRQIKEAFTIMYRRRLTTPQALKEMDQCAEWGNAAGKFRDFVRRAFEATKPHHRGIGRLRSRSAKAAEE